MGPKAEEKEASYAQTGQLSSNRRSSQKSPSSLLPCQAYINRRLGRAVGCAVALPPVIFHVHSWNSPRPSFLKYRGFRKTNGQPLSLAGCVCAYRRLVLRVGKDFRQEAQRKENRVQCNPGNSVGSTSWEYAMGPEEASEGWVGCVP